MRRPLVIVAIFYACGLLLAEYCRAPISLLFAGSLVVAVVALTVHRARPVLLWLLIVLAGWTHLAFRTATLSPHDLRLALTHSAEQVVVRGHICEAPSERIYVRNEIETTRTLLMLSTEAICRTNQWQPALGNVLATVPAVLPREFFAGQEIEVAGIVAPPRRPVAQGLFDYPAYLRRQGVYFELETSGIADCRLISTNRSPPLSDRFLPWAQATLARGIPERDKPLRLLCAMTLGSKNTLTSDAYAPFIQSGTMHIFAISGLHIALIAGVLVSLLRVLQVSRLWCGVVVIPLIWFYAAATGWQSSAVRSTLMMTIIVGGWSLKRPSDLLNSLAAAALIILLAEPRQLFQASFQLSFFVVLSIALFLPPIKRFTERLFQHDPLLPEELIPRWQRWLMRPVRGLLAFLATSLAAWLGAWPLTAYYFHLFSPVTLLANVLVVPISSAALACNMGSLLCGAWFPFATELFNHSAWFWMWLMMRVSEIGIQLPGAFFYVAMPALADFFIYYGALVAVLSGSVFVPGRRLWVIAGISCIGLFYGWRWHTAQQCTEMTVLPLNGGSAVYCDGPGTRDDLLVDCGNSNAVVFTVLPFLRAQGVNQIECLALSHGDLKCMGGAPLLQENLRVRYVATSSAKFRSAAYRKTIAALDETPERHRLLKAGDSVAQWTVLHPNAGAGFAQADDDALVLRGSFYGHRVLLLSDLGRQGQERLLTCGQDLGADIVVTGLPQQSEALSDPLLERIQPRVIIVVDSEFPATRRAGERLRERLARQGIPVLYTRRAGAVRLSMDARRLIVHPMNEPEIRVEASSCHR